MVGYRLNTITREGFRVWACVIGGGIVWGMDIDDADVSSLPQGYKRMPCRYCDKPIVVSNRRKQKPHHFECGMKAAADAMNDMANKSGPYYEKYLEGMRKRFSGEGTGGTP